MDRPDLLVIEPRPASPPLIAARLVRLLTEPFAILAVVHLTILGWRLPLFDRLPGWVFATHAKSMSVAWWLLLAIVPGISIGPAVVMRRSRAVALACLIAGGFVFQHGLALSEGRGLDGMRERIVRSGHAEFADVAVAQRSLWSVATRYERKVQGGELGRYAHSKPPGTLLTYMATERLSRLFAQDDSVNARRAALNTTAALVWPLVGCLAVIPLYAIVRSISGEGTALVAATSYSLVPSVSLMTLHTDQFLFPLLGLTGLWTATVAARRRSRAWAFGSGLWLWVAGYFTFPLLLLAPVSAAFVWSETLRQHAIAVPARDSVRSAARLCVLMALGLVAGLVLFRVALGYDVFTRFADARQFNVVWKGWDGGAFQTLYFAWMNALEFILWVGVPIAVLGLARVRRAMIDAAAGTFGGMGLPAITIALVLVYVTFFGQAKGETARLWLFIVPLLCALAADELATRFGEARPAATTLVLALQWVTVMLTKTGQDFF